MNRMHIGSGVAVAIAALAAAALGAQGAAGSVRTAPQAPVVLRMANGYADLGYEPAVAYFVKRVQQRSHGALRVEVVSDWGNYKPGYEQRIVRDVAGRKADLGWVGTRIFDTLGVRSLQALTAPMLIDSYPLERAVIASGLPARMLAGLAPLHVTGLAVLADGLRKPIAVDGPLLGPGDWRGVTFAAFRSRGQATSIRALGATPSEAWSDALAAAIDSGAVQGFEKNLLVYGITGLAKSAPYVTANVNLWPQTAALLANPARVAALTTAQQSWLRGAAADASARSAALAAHDQRLVAPLCKAGARFANASADDLAALRTAFAPVYAQLSQDPQTRAFIAGIRRLKSSTAAGPALSIPSGCATTPRRTASADSSRSIDGVYRVSWPAKELIAAGASRAYARGNAGVVTMTLRNRALKLSYLDAPDCLGRYRVVGAGITIVFDRRSGCHGEIVARWSLTGSQLRLRVSKATDPGDEIVFGRKPWRRLGPAAFAVRAPAPTALDGVYRVSWTQQELLAAGAGASYAKHNHGTMTLTLRSGRFHERWSIPPSCDGVYSLSGKTVAIRYTHVCSGWVRARWSFGNGLLRLHVVAGSDRGGEIRFGAKPWKKIA